MAASNAALALVQQGDEAAAVREMQKTLRRAPGSADLRAALAALYWSQACTCHLKIQVLIRKSATTTIMLMILMLIQQELLS